MKFEVIASKRDVQGTGASRRLRHAGKVPGIVYGAGKDAVALEMDHNDLLQQLRKEAFHSSVLTLNVGGEKEPVLLRDVQVHPFKRQVLHVDFQRVDKTHKIHMKVPLHFLNGENAPGVKLQGGVLSHVITEVEVSCLADELPEYLEVDLSELAAGHSVHLSHVKLPKGVECVALQRGEDPTVATILGVRGEAEAEAAAPAAPTEGA
ncbi:LSU ribosomal protein L25P [Sulfuritortus calidifontis]|uniref:Large ribosomal subunit protein bL25 n=1 Tax=Sulfuritortus calidifontis TaxID=1914471 RepID=A0A4R3JYC9_9PROT|nr:50S ribosomal protein L25/general stress protein Ctc [Sulfuritortus calidifontis]TCS73484.1 LSU ribosomal protein L25P [Sulfuritortus calidifontis]